MPLSPGALKKAEEIEESLRSRIENDPDVPDYDEVSTKLSRLGALIDETYKSQRSVDDTGKLTEDATTRQPARVGEGDADYFFEPNVREVQAFFKRNPDALDRLRDSKGNPLRPWAEGEAQPEIRTPRFDPQANAIGPIGYDVTPAKTHLDALSEEQEPYGVAADEMWRLASESANQRGKALKRYRDIKLDTNEWKDYIEGGIKKGLSRIVAPASLGAADSMSAGQASPLYDTMRDLAIYRQSRMSPEERATARAMGYPEDAEDMGSAEDIQNRSMPAYVGGNLYGYSMSGNPANVTQKVINEAMKYGARGTLGRVGTAAVSGAVANAEESVLGDMARYANEGESIPVGDMAKQMGINALGAGAIGAVGGGSFDLAGQGIGAAREGFRRYERNAPLRTLEEAGGRADFATGVAAPVEIREAYEKMHDPDPDRPPTTAGGELAADLAPHVDQSVRKRALDEQARTAAEMKEYYNHPAYRDRKVSAKVAVDGLLAMANRGIARGPVDGSMMPMDPRAVDEIGGILREYSQSGTPVPRADAPSIAHATGGVVVDGELANRLYGYKPDDPNYFRPGTDAVVRPIEINAEKLTVLEERIANELKYAKIPGGADDAVWQEFNARVKDMRDNFPAYKDAEGKLVPPPIDQESSPFDLADDVPRGPTRGQYMAPPTAVGEPSKPPYIDEPGIGPGQGPFLPKGPFDQRAGKPQGAPADELPRPIDIGGEGMVARPEGLYAVGPGGPRIPENLFDPLLPTSREAIRPMATREVSGGEYGPPPPLDPSARLGVGDRFNPEPAVAFTQEGLPVPRGVSAQPTVSVKGSYNRPPEVQMERAPTTERNPYGHVNRGQPEPEVPLPPSERNPFAPSPVAEESLSTLAGNKLAMKAEEPLRGEPELTEEVFQREYGPTKPVIEKPTAGKVSKEDAIALANGQYDVGELDNRAQDLIDHGFRVTASNLHARDQIGGADRMGKPDKNGNAKNEGLAGTVNEELKPLLDKEVSGYEAARTEAPTGKRYAVLDQQDGALREKTFATAAEAKAEAKRLGEKFKSKGRFKVKGVDAPAAAAPDERGGLEQMLDAQLDRPDAPPVPKTEIEDIGRQQTADREQVAENWKNIDELFSKNREQRAAELKKIRVLGDHPEALDEAIEQIKKIDKRLGPLTPQQRVEMLVSAIKAKTGVDIKPEDLIRFGLISSGLVAMSADDRQPGDTKEAGFGIGSVLVALGLAGKGKKGQPEAETPKGPSKPARPTQPEVILDNGEVKRGFSAMRNREHTRLEAIEKAMKRLGVEGDTTLESRIRTYGQVDDRGKVDKALLEEVKAIDQREAKERAARGDTDNKGPTKEDALRRAAGANVYPGLRDRSWPGGSSRSIGNAIIDMAGVRFYRTGEYLSGRFNRKHERNPFVRGNDTTSSEMQQSLLEEPARRLFNLTGGGPASRLGAEELWELIKSDSQYESSEDYEKKQKEQRP